MIKQLTGTDEVADRRCLSGFQVLINQILKNDAVKVLHSICQQIWKTQQCPFNHPQARITQSLLPHGTCALQAAWPWPQGPLQTPAGTCRGTESAGSPWAQGSGGVVLHREAEAKECLPGALCSGGFEIAIFHGCLSSQAM